MMPDYVAYSSLIIDDIVLPDGRTFMNVLGGAGTHALVGMRVWSDRLGFVAGAGHDLDPEHRARLTELGIDLRGLVLSDADPTPRAWQLFEADQRRVEVFRTDIADFRRMEPSLDAIPEDYLTARGFYINWGTPAELIEIITRLRSRNPAVRLVWEPTEDRPTACDEAMQCVLAQVDLFSPDRNEARELTGAGSEPEMIDRLLAWGATTVALRMGADGSLVGTADGEYYRIPAVPTDVVDSTGAGNAYCGGFLVGLGNGESVAEAAARAAVSASFALEQFGVPRFDEQTVQEATRRLSWVRDRLSSGTTAVP